MERILQNTPEWLEAKKKYIGASEIYSIIPYYCKESCDKFGIVEPSFKTPVELFCKIQFGVENTSFDPVSREFGLGMEPYIISRINAEAPNLIAIPSKDFIINEQAHPLAACSPDGYVDVMGDGEVNDFDKKHIITKEDGRGVLELKTCDYFFNKIAKEGPKWQYIFQLQYQMLVCNKEWGVIACIAPDELGFDNDFQKGKSLAFVKSGNLYDIKNIYNLYYFIYKKNEVIQKMILESLKGFEKDIERNKLPSLCEDNISRIYRERFVLKELGSNRFGTVDLDETDPRNQLLDDIVATAIEEKKARTEKEAAKNELIKLMADHLEIRGLNHRAFFNKKGGFYVK